MIIKSSRQNSMPQIKSTLSFILILGILSFNSASGASIPSEISFIENKTKRNSQNVCLKDECEIAARGIRENIEEEVNPCDNFYQFACGNFMKSTIIPDHKDSIVNFYVTKHNAIFKLIDILENNTNYSKSVNIETPRRAYKACMNIADVEQNGLYRLLKVLNDLGRMPILVGNSWPEKEFDLIEVIYKLRNMGYPFDKLFSITTILDPSNSTYYALDITRPKIAPVNFKNVYNTQKENMDYVFSALKVDKSLMRKDIEDMLDFMLKLLALEVTEKFVKYYIDTNRIPNNSEFYLELLKKLLPYNVTGIGYIDVDYMDHFAMIMDKTPKRVQANYVFWNVIEFSIQHMFVGKSIDPFHKSPRYEDCIGNILKIFPNLQAAYLQTYLTKKRLLSAEIYVNNVQKALQDNIRNSKWIDESIKQEIIKKIENIHKFVGHSHAYNISDDEMKRIFDESLKNGIFQEFYLKASKIQIDRRIERWGKTVYRSIWTLLQTDVNAAFIEITNSIYIPGGVLNDMLFNENLPSYLNYAGLGFVAGHELSHSIDPENVRYDKNGILNKSWNNGTEAKYIEKINCFTAQYENFTVGNMTLNTRSTLDEDIADWIGFKAAYTAYINSDMGINKEPLLPELKYNQRQLFWIKSANIWCAKFNYKFLLRRIQSDSHSLYELRILRSFANLDEFSKDFNCPVGSKMNPKDKCLI